MLRNGIPCFSWHQKPQRRSWYIHFAYNKSGACIIHNTMELEESKDCWIGFAFLESEKYKKQYRPGIKEKIEDFFVGLIRPLRFCHVEIANPDTGEAYSSTKGEGVRVANRAFSSDSYGWWKMNVTRRQFNVVFQYLNSKLKCPYNYWGFYINFILPAFMNPYDANEKAFMCTELVANSLIHAGIVKRAELNPLTCDTDQLFAHLLKLGLVIYAKPGNDEEGRSMVMAGNSHLFDFSDRQEDSDEDSEEDNDYSSTTATTIATTRPSSSRRNGGVERDNHHHKQKENNSNNIVIDEDNDDDEYYGIGKTGSYRRLKKEKSPMIQKPKKKNQKRERKKILEYKLTSIV